MSPSESSLIEIISNVLRTRKNEIDTIKSTSHTALVRIRSEMVRFAFMAHSYEITSFYVKLNLVSNLLNRFFEKKLTELISQEILTDKYDLPFSLKETLSRELGNIDAAKHFDSDYVVRFEILEKDLTTIKNLKNIDEISKTSINQNLVNTIFNVINDSSVEVIEEGNAKLKLFLEKTIQALEEDPSFNRLNKEVDAFAIALHNECYGWK